MIYKKTETNNTSSIKKELGDSLKSFFCFDKTLNLMLSKNRLRILETQKEEKDRFFCSDIASSIFNPFYSNDLRISARLYHALLINHLYLIKDNNFCDEPLKNYNYDFLGLILRDEELTKRYNNDNEYYKTIFVSEELLKVNHTPTPAYRDGVSLIDGKLKEVFHGTREKKDFNAIKYSHPIKHIFEDDLYNENVLFTIVGSQTLEWNYARVKKASLLIAELINAKIVDPKKTQIILSGRNNATSKQMKVHFSNEAEYLLSVLIYRLEEYLDNRVDFNTLLSLGRIKIEDKSTNTSENIKETASDYLETSHSFSAFYISNTFHLPQISSELQNIEDIFKPKNLYLVGSENPKDNFKGYDNELVKHLYNRTINICSKKLSKTK